MTPRTVKIVCAKSKVPSVPAVVIFATKNRPRAWFCSFCGARVRVVA